MSILLLYLTVAIFAEEANEIKVGDYVFRKNDAKAYRMDGTEVPIHTVPWRGTIGAVENGRVWFGYVWIDAKSVMPPSVAKEFFAQQAKEHPDDPQWMIRQAAALRSLAENEKAFALLENTVERYPQDWQACLDYADMLRIKNRSDEAKAHIYRAYDLAPNRVEVHLARGKLFAVAKEFDDAIVDFSQAIKLRPDLSGGYLYRGQANYAVAKYQLAIADFDACLRINPYSFNAYRNRGDTWRQLKEFDKAIADYTDAIRLEPTDALSFMGRGLSYDKKRSYEQAVLDYEEALRLDPKNYAVFQALAFLQATCKDPEFRNGKKAIENAQRACELTERQPFAIAILAAAYAETGEFDMAIKLIEEAIEKEPNEFKKAWMSVAIIQFRAKMPLRDPRLQP